MPALFAMAALVVAAVALVALPSGRQLVSALAGSVARWPGLIRDELRGAAPLRVDGGAAGDGPDTTPDIPPVTRGLPVVERPDRR